MASRTMCHQRRKHKKEVKYYLVEFANSIGKSTAELKIGDMIKFCRRSYLNEGGSK